MNNNGVTPHQVSEEVTWVVSENNKIMASFALDDVVYDMFIDVIVGHLDNELKLSVSYNGSASFYTTHEKELISAINILCKKVAGHFNSRNGVDLSTALLAEEANKLTEKLF